MIFFQTFYYNSLKIHKKENQNFYSDLTLVFSKLGNIELEQGSILSR